MNECIPVSGTSGAAHPWGRAPPDPALLDADVHLWCVALDRPPWPLERLARTLSADESQRANAFVFPADRRRFLTARGALRMLLGRYLDRAPESIRFGYGPNGKPELERPGGNPPVCFNYTHSQGLALYAVTREWRLGVDLEALRPLPDVGQIARLCCSDREQLALAAVPADQRAEAFFRAWTMKEAYAKAIGDGLAGGLDRIEVALTSGGVPEVHAVDSNPDAAGRWSVRALSPAAGHVAAYAVERHGYRLRCWSF